MRIIPKFSREQLPYEAKLELGIPVREDVTMFTIAWLWWSWGFGIHKVSDDGHP